jgi:GrpB-like predicted nucleotidyltransferase (UPF0157 family)
MRLLRFDPEVSIPVESFGSRFRVGPLTGDGSRVKVQIIHIGPDGLIGRHPTTSQQLLGVVAGSGWVSGADGRQRDIRSGQAALWDPAENHAAGSQVGMTAVCVEGCFEVWALAITRDIVVSEYSSDWPDWFEELRSRIWPAVQELALRIDHVGSTAVPGLAAKPIIDMDIVLADETNVQAAVQALAALGYRWRGDLGVPGRQAFTLQGANELPPHHLYLVVENNKSHLDHWLLRDLLRADAEARERYAELKRRNAEAAEGDIDHYVAAKAAFVAELLSRARRERGLAPETYWVPDTTEHAGGPQGP